MNYGSGLPITYVRDPDVSSSGTSISDHMDEIFLKNPTTGNYIRVFAMPAANDADSMIQSEPE